jgi:hypothetical protein
LTIAVCPGSFTTTAHPAASAAANGRLDCLPAQQWQVEVHAGSALDDPFRIVDLVTEARQPPRTCD